MSGPAANRNAIDPTASVTKGYRNTEEAFTLKQRTLLHFLFLADFLLRRFLTPAVSGSKAYFSGGNRGRMPWQLSNSRRAEGEPKRNRRGGIAASEKQKQRRLETKRRKVAS
mmetsp:Transcript_99329/g.148739  ORF Transcript_99329/g.148739 Transcript_99329/m.148739 type:complete len:112 (+) Transcript_99329:263-598(+)